VRESAPPPWSVRLVGLATPLAEIDEHIQVRVQRMIEAGWLDEVRRVRRDFAAADLGRLGHGYPELAAHLDGRLTLAEVLTSTVRQIRQYARRQLTWFKADPRVQWIAPDIETAVARLSAGIMKAEAS
jgi:tRNA dimethylallyltransferase